jgi:hypothetical protein
MDLYWLKQKLLRYVDVVERTDRLHISIYSYTVVTLAHLGAVAFELKYSRT